eukprot:TRINITY_DN19150_c0_g1_i1.p1 TRINITY_DN19150_c0_g1~~TRINITY_DN19150_c0_g1_i1.p1  ORF type:complete len:784 (-),score=190.25 TRINITY_DN19150_c0_g1_i1:135-2486(-)
MTLAVLGRESVSELRRMIEERFESVPATGKRALRGEEHGGPEPAIKPDDFAGLVLREPSKDMRQISFAWQLERWQVPLWKSKPGAYASYVLGHEGEGSLLSALKNRAWATSLSAGVDEFGSFSQFDVSVTLTEEGLEHIEEIGEMLFRYLRLIKATPVMEWVLDEMQKLREMRFRFADVPQPYNLVNSLATNLQKYPAENVMSAGIKLASPDAMAAGRILEQLGADGLRVELVAKKFGERCTSKDPWYGGRFQRLPLEESWLHAWKAAASRQSDDATMEAEKAAVAAAVDGVRLPKPNPFVPASLAVKPHLEGAVISEPLPLDVAGTGVSKAFHRQDDRFLQPKASLALRFHSPAVAKDTASYLRCQLWCNAVMEELNEYAYDAESAGLSYHLGAVPGGLELSVAGFDDKLPVLLATVAHKMREMDQIPARTFTIVRDRFERSLKNRATKQRPCDFAGRKVHELVYSLAFPVEDQLEVLLSLNASDLDGENMRLLTQCKAEALLLGNLGPEDAADVLGVVSRELGVPVEPSTLPWRAEAVLPPGYTVWEIDGTDKEERNNNVRLEMQLPESLENSLYLSLLVRLLNPRFFAELRTQQQLGYIVQMSWTEKQGFLSILCTVQTEYAPDYVRSQIDAFFASRLDWILKELDETEFDRQVAGLDANLAEAPKNLREEFDRYWGEITRLRYEFGRRDKKRQALKEVTLEKLRHFVQAHVSSAPRLFVQVHSISGGPGKSAPEGSGVVPRTPDRIWHGDEDRKRFRASAQWVALGEDVAVSSPPHARL